MLEVTVGATLAWIVATQLGHPEPFFAPAATILVLSQARGARISRALEVFLAVAGGVLLADIVAQLLAPWPTLTIFVLVGLTLTVTTTGRRPHHRRCRGPAGRRRNGRAGVAAT